MYRIVKEDQISIELPLKVNTHKLSPQIILFNYCMHDGSCHYYRPGFEFYKTWLHAPGWPPYEPDLSAGQELTDPVEALVTRYTSSEEQVSTTELSAEVVLPVNISAI